MAEGLEPVRSVESVKEMGQFNMEKAQADLIDVSESIFNLKGDQILEFPSFEILKTWL